MTTKTKKFEINKNLVILHDLTPLLKSETPGTESVVFSK